VVKSIEGDWILTAYWYLTPL